MRKPRKKVYWQFLSPLPFPIFYRAENNVYDTVGAGLHGYISYCLINIAFGLADNVVCAGTKPSGFIDREIIIEGLGFQDFDRV